MTEVLGRKKLISRSVLVAGVLTVSACSTSEGRDPELVERCTEETKSDIRADFEHEGPNNPDTLLQFIDDNDDHDYLDSGEKGWIAGDRINGIGEVICRIADEDGHTKQTFLLKDVLEAREDYLSEPDRVRGELGVEETTTTVH